jgi:hypothetical protein
MSATAVNSKPSNEKVNPTRQKQEEVAAKKKEAAAAAPAGEAKEKKPAAEKKPAEPKTMEVSSYKLAPGIEIEKLKGQRKEVIQGMIDLGKPGTFEEINAKVKHSSRQSGVSVTKYHVLKALSDGLVIEDSKTTVTVEPKPRKAKEAAVAEPAKASA